MRTAKHYVSANEAVRSELAVPLIVKGRVIGVIDIESEEVGYFQEEQLRLLELTASRVAVAIENARLYTRVSRQAQTLAVLTEISRDLSSILDLDELLERIGQLLRRLIDYQMFSILLLNERDQVLETQFAVRFGERYVPIERVPLGRGLVGVAVQTQAPVYVTGCAPRCSLSHGQSAHPVRAGRSPDLQEEGDRRPRSGAHARQLLQRRPPAHHRDASRPDRDRH